ncbi:MAG: hypothetical protein V7K92_00280 [Nostoc sp.]|uniref:hypothetical protein n=1 Tax=Nostoc sp. TaxID=1180 RepID=UPI002FF10152
MELVPQGGNKKSKVKSQKYYRMRFSGLFRDFKWLLYFRRGVLVSGIAEKFLADMKISRFKGRGNY